MKSYDKVGKIRYKISIRELMERYRKSEKDFTRERKIKFEDVIYFTLNKRGLSLKMEMKKFEDMTGRMKDVSKSALCQQRKKIDPRIFKELNSDYIKNSYDNPEDYKTLKGYIVMAIDGMKIEIPDVEELREEYGTSKGREGQRTSARALTSCLYDVVNNWVIDAQIDKFKASERELAKDHIVEMVVTLADEIDLEKTIIIFDRGYPSMDMIYVLKEAKIKYLFRAPNSRYKKEISNMKKEDEEVSIAITKSRMRNISDAETREKLKEMKTIESRFVKYKLETGETELLITNLSSEEFTGEELGELYFKRWNIELAYNIAKNKLEIQNFSGQSKVVIEQEFYAQMLMLNIAEDLRKEANERVTATQENGCKYDYQVNMNTLIGLLRERFILILFSIALNNDEESNREYDKLIEEISKDIVPIRPGRKNERVKYKGYNKYKKNLRRNS